MLATLLVLGLTALQVQEPVEASPRNSPLREEAPQEVPFPNPMGPVEMADPEKSPAAQEFRRRLGEEEIELDRAAGQVRWKAVVLRDRSDLRYPIEYLVTTENGSTHETIFLCRVTPSLLNACFLALGLTPGRTIRFVKRAGESDESGSPEESPYEVIPPQGPVVFLYVEWEDAAGHNVIHPLEDLLMDLEDDELLPVRGFVYVGSRFRRSLYHGRPREVFMADIEGNLVAGYLAGLGNCLFDLNSVLGQWDDRMGINAELIPKRESLVKIVAALQPVEGTRRPDSDVMRHLGIGMHPRVLREDSANAFLKQASDEELAPFEGLTFSQVAGLFAGGSVTGVSAGSVAGGEGEGETKSETACSLAAALLGATRSPAAGPVLLRGLLAEKIPSVREVIVAALAELQSFDVVASLIQLLENEDPGVRETAHFALRHLSGTDLAAESAVWKDWLQEHIDLFR
ncbi:MAG: YdjY domain-containing protein [Planctomycetota bacterium]